MNTIELRHRKRRFIETYRHLAKAWFVNDNLPSAYHLLELAYQEGLYSKRSNKSLVMQALQRVFREVEYGS